MEFKDYYQILGVDRKADQKAISQAFRKLARQHHPDVNPGNKQAEARFKDINEAHQVLSDPEKRAKYDQVLELREHGGGWAELLRRGGGRGGGVPWSLAGGVVARGPNTELSARTAGGGGLVAAAGQDTGEHRG